MALKIPLPAVLAIAGLFEVGGIWWCDDCGAGGFRGGLHALVAPVRSIAHRPGCAFRGRWS